MEKRKASRRFGRGEKLMRAEGGQIIKNDRKNIDIRNKRMRKDRKKRRKVSYGDRRRDSLLRKGTKNSASLE